MRKLAKLHRSRNNRMLAGVFGGIAEYLGWSANTLRLLFVLSIPLTATVSLWVAMVAYAFMMILMPEATHQSYVENATSPRRIH